MTMDSDRAWREWGKTEPYFSVVTLPEFKVDRLAGNVDRFFETGQLDVSTLMEQIAMLWGEIPTTRALDFGCGVGRLVLPLSERFEHVVGVDISAEMIAEASRNCAKSDVRNVDFAMSDDGLTAVNGSFDLVHSYIVLQHIPVERGLALTERMLARLRPGGVAALHYSLQRTLSPALAFAYAVQHRVPLGRGAMNLVRGRRWNAPIMQMNNYRLADIVRVFEKNGLTDIVIIPEWQETVLTARALGRKAAPAGAIPGNHLVRPTTD